MNIHTNRLEQVVPHVYVAPTHEDVQITIKTSERIDELFDMVIDTYISESGLRDELDFEHDRFIENYSFDDKLNYILDRVNGYNY